MHCFLLIQVWPEVAPAFEHILDPNEVVRVLRDDLCLFGNPCFARVRGGCCCSLRPRRPVPVHGETAAFTMCGSRQSTTNFHDAIEDRGIRLNPRKCDCLAAKPSTGPMEPVSPRPALPVAGRSRWLKRVYQAATVNKVIGWLAVPPGVESPAFQAGCQPNYHATTMPPEKWLLDATQLRTALIQCWNSLLQTPVTEMTWLHALVCLFGNEASALCLRRWPSNEPNV